MCPAASTAATAVINSLTSGTKWPVTISVPAAIIAFVFAVLVGILVFANWGAAQQKTGVFAAVYSVKWLLTSALGFVLERRSQTLCVLTAIDNLGKGAAGQAVQNLNLMLGHDEAAGLLGLAPVP